MPLHFVDETVELEGAGDQVVLSGAEAHHAASVRRVRAGEAVTIANGRGAWLSGSVAHADPKTVAIRIDARADVAAPTQRILLAQALAKGDRDELAVQTATELGIDGIVPWQAARSVSRWQGPKAEKGRARWQTIAREAAKQSHRAWIPAVESVSTVRALASRAAEADVVVLDPWADVSLTARGAATDRDVVLVVGPEGGIAPEELDALEEAGAHRVRLGEHVLRTSTAGPAALAVLNAQARRW